MMINIWTSFDFSSEPPEQLFLACHADDQDDQPIISLLFGHLVCLGNVLLVLLDLFCRVGFYLLSDVEKPVGLLNGGQVFQPL